MLDRNRRGIKYRNYPEWIIFVIDVHDSFELLVEPQNDRLREFLQTYRICSKDCPPIYDQFDFLEWPELVSWMAVVHYPFSDRHRYSSKNARVIFHGARCADMFEEDMTDQSSDELDDQFQDRWSSIYGLCLTHKEPKCARSRVFGIGKDHVRFEIVLLPFAEKGGVISHILSVVQRVYD